MPVEHESVNPLHSEPPEQPLARAVELLKAGQLVAFPTETVYGLGADASNEEALQRLYAAKGRPESHPVIVHLGRLEQLSDWARDIPEATWQLGKAFWPGPLTLILPKQPQVSTRVTGGQDSIGLRIPNHPVALALLQAFGGGIAAPSANRFGHLSPTRAADVAADLGDAVSLVLDGGPCQVGIESTIVDLTGEQAVILRPGMISAAQIEAVLGQASTQKPQSATRAPGTLASHYAPRTPVRLVSPQDFETTLRQNGHKVAILARILPKSEQPGIVAWIQAPTDAEPYAQALYASLRKLDQAQADEILVEAVPDTPEWLGIRDRLQRAAHPTDNVESREDTP